MKMGQVLGGRRKGPRSKKASKKKKAVKVSVKVKGNVNQVSKAIKQMAGVEKGVNVPSQSQADRGDDLSFMGKADGSQA